MKKHVQLSNLYKSGRKVTIFKNKTMMMMIYHNQFKVIFNSQNKYDLKKKYLPRFIQKEFNFWNGHHLYYKIMRSRHLEFVRFISL